MLNNAKEYTEFAKKFTSNPPKNSLQISRINGDKIIYDPSSNIFAIAKNDGTPKTIYKPRAGVKYWENIIKREVIDAEKK